MSCVFYISAHTHTHTHIHIYIYIYIYICTHTHTHTHTHTTPQTCSRQRLWQWRDKCAGCDNVLCILYFCTYTHTHAYIYIHIYMLSLSFTHTHTYATPQTCSRQRLWQWRDRCAACENVLRHSSPHKTLSHPTHSPPHRQKRCCKTFSHHFATQLTARIATLSAASHESDMPYDIIWMRLVTYEWGMSRMNEACHTWIRHCMNESRHIWTRKSRMWTRKSHIWPYATVTYAFVLGMQKKKKIYAFVLGVFRIVTSDSFVFICDMTHSYDVRFIWLIIDIIYEYHVTWIQHVTWVRHHMNIMSHEYNMCTTSDTACVRGRIQSRGGIHSRDVAWHDLFTSCLIHMTHSRHHIWISCHMNTTSDMNIISHDVVFVWLFCSRRNT